MLITSHPTGKDSMSPFPFRIKPFTVAGATGSSVIIPKYTSVTSLITSIYDHTSYRSVQYQFPFLDRDNRERVYRPGEEDPFVFRDAGSINMFKDVAIDINAWLVDHWKQLGYPIKKDEDRGINVIDSEGLMETLRGASDSTMREITKDYPLLAFLSGNADIAKKFCIVRAVISGWWLNSYNAKKEENSDYFAESVKVHSDAFRLLKQTNQFRNRRDQFFSDMADPLDTNVGFPFYSSGIDSKIKLLALFKKIASGSPYSSDSDFSQLKNEIASRVTDPYLREFLFAVATLRRSQYGRKPSHVIDVTGHGSYTLYDVMGFPSTRIAWMFSYLYNLLLTPLVADWNTFRYFTPGGYHDGNQKTLRTRVQRKESLYMLECDYTNYDQYQLLDMMMRWTIQCYDGHPALRNYIAPLLQGTYRNIPLFLPNYHTGSKGNGILIMCKKLGLLSGAKHTSAGGTIHNSIINIAGFINHKLMSRKDALDYLMQYRNDTNVGGNVEWSHMQSDDTLIMADNISDLLKRGWAFKEAADKAGLKSSINLADRFLMRQCYKGKDLPVECRIFQNTISNEDPVVDPLKFLVGLASRTDGVLGQRSVDPFGVGKFVPVSVLQAEFTRYIFSHLNEFLRKARIPSEEAIAFTSLIVGEATRMSKNYSRSDPSTWRSDVLASDDYARAIDEKRRAYARALASQELNRIGSDKSALNEWISRLITDSHNPSSARTLAMLGEMMPGIASSVSSSRRVDSEFFQKALETVGVHRYFS